MATNAAQTDDDDLEAPDDEEVEGQEQEVPEAAAAGEPVTAGDLEVDLSEPIDMGDGKKTDPAIAAPKKPNRYKALKRENGSLKAEMAELRGRIEAMSRQAPQVIQQQGQPPQNPIERKIEGLEDQRQGLLTQLSAPNISKEDGEKLLRQYRRVENELHDSRFQLNVQRMGLRPPQPDNPQAVERRMLEAEFPQVYTDPVLRSLAEAEMTRLVQRQKKPVNIATARMAAKNVLRNEGILRGEPSAGEKAKLTSVSSRAGGAGSGDAKFKPNRLQLNAARAYTAHLPDMQDSDRVKKWVKEVGRPNGLV